MLRDFKLGSVTVQEAGMRAFLICNDCRTGRFFSKSEG